MSTSHRALLVLLASVTLGCSAEGQPSPSGENRAALITDQAHGSGTPGFFWLPPLVTEWPRVTDPFAGGVGPTVAIDRIVLGGFTRVATLSGENVREITDCRPGPLTPPVCPYYGATWSAARVRAGEQYRVRVLVGTRELGLVDVQVVATSDELSRVDRRRFAPLVAGDGLPIPFRIGAGDFDADGVVDWRDNCPRAANRDQLDWDRDGKGDACECDGVVCRAQDRCHDAGTCNPRTGGCSSPLRADASGCMVGGIAPAVTTIASGGDGTTIDVTSRSTPCASGTVGQMPNYSGFAEVDLPLPQAVGASGSTWTPAGAGLVVDVTNSGGSPLRVVIQGPSGYPGELWCARLISFGEPVFLPWESFSTECWNSFWWAGNPGSRYDRTPLKSVGVMVPGDDDTPTAFGFCLNRLGVAETGSVEDCTPWGSMWSGKYAIVNAQTRAGIAGSVQCIDREATLASFPFGWHWTWPATDPGGIPNFPKAFPEIVYGRNPWTAVSTTSELPRRISEINQLTVSYDVALSASGSGDLAFDIWINSTNPPTEASITHEVMVWLDHWADGLPDIYANTTGYARDGGRPVAVTIDGEDYDLYKKREHGSPGGYTHTLWAFMRRTPKTAGTIDLQPFLQYLGELPANDDPVSSSDYCSSVEFGNEILWGSGSSHFSRYSITLTANSGG